MDTTNESPLPEGANGKDELDDSWFDLPALDVTPPKKARAPEDDLDDSWFDRPGRELRRSDVIGRR